MRSNLLMRKLGSKICDHTNCDHDHSQVKEAYDKAGKLSGLLLEMGRITEASELKAASIQIEKFAASKSRAVPMSINSAVEKIENSWNKYAKLFNEVSLSDFDDVSDAIDSKLFDQIDCERDEATFGGELMEDLKLAAVKLADDEKELNSDLLTEGGVEDIPAGEMTENTDAPPPADEPAPADTTNPPAEATDTTEVENDYTNFSTEALVDMIKTLSTTDGFGGDKESQRAVADMAKVLFDRPLEVETEKVAAIYKEVPRDTIQDPEGGAKDVVQKEASNKFKGLNLVTAAVEDEFGDEKEKRWNLYKDNIEDEGVMDPEKESAGTFVQNLIQETFKFIKQNLQQIKQLNENKGLNAVEMFMKKTPAGQASNNHQLSMLTAQLAEGTINENQFMQGIERLLQKTSSSKESPIMGGLNLASTV